MGRAHTIELPEPRKTSRVSVEALQAAALGLGTCVVGAFTDKAVAELLGLGRGEQPLVFMPFGRR